MQNINFLCLANAKDEWRKVFYEILKTCIGSWIFFYRLNHLLFYVKTCWIMISCFIFYSPFCLMNLLQKIPLQFDEEEGLWFLRRELAVSVSHHALHLCLFGSKFLSLQNCCAFNTWKKKKKTALSFEFLIRYQC